MGQKQIPDCRAGENRAKHSKSVKCRVYRSIIPGVGEKRNLDKGDEHAMGLHMAQGRWP